MYISAEAESTPLITLTPEDIELGTYNIDRQATAGSSFTIGGSCSSKLSFTLNSVGLAKVRVFKALARGYCIRLVEWLLTEDPNQSTEDITLNKDNSENETGRVPIGSFYISNIGNSDSFCSIEAFDSMLAFSRKLTKADSKALKEGLYTIKELLVRFVASCTRPNKPIVLDDNIDNVIINPAVKYSIGKDASLDSYRSALDKLSTLAGGFFTIDRLGKLTLRRFSKEPIRYIDEHNVFDYTMDEELRVISGVSISSSNGALLSQKPVTEGKGTVLSLDDNIFLNEFSISGVEDEEKKLMYILDGIRDTLYGTKFYGGTFTTPHRPELDLGDTVTFSKYYREPISGNFLTFAYNNVILCRVVSNGDGFDTITCDHYTPEKSRAIKTSSKKGSSGGKTVTGGGTLAKASTYLSDFLRQPLGLTSGRTLRVFNITMSLPEGAGAMASFTICYNVTHIGTLKFKIKYNGNWHLLKPTYTIHNLGFGVAAFDVGLDPSLSSNGAKTLMLYIESQDDLELTIDKEQAQCILTASGIKSSKADWTGLFEVEDDISKGFVFKSPFHIAGLTEKLSTSTERG